MTKQRDPVPDSLVAATTASSNTQKMGAGTIHASSTSSLKATKSTLGAFKLPEVGNLPFVVALCALLDPFKRGVASEPDV